MSGPANIGQGAAPYLPVATRTDTDGNLVQLVDGSNGPLATQAGQAALLAAMNVDTGTWSYVAGVSGTVVAGAGKRVVGISATASGAGAYITINGGDQILVMASTALNMAPRGQLVAPTIVFSGTSTYLVEMVT